MRGPPLEEASFVVLRLEGRPYAARLQAVDREPSRLLAPSPGGAALREAALQEVAPVVRHRVSAACPEVARQDARLAEACQDAVLLAEACQDAVLLAEAFQDAVLLAGAFQDAVLLAGAFQDAVLQAEAFQDAVLQAEAFQDAELQAEAFQDEAPRAASRLEGERLDVELLELGASSSGEVDHHLAAYSFTTEAEHLLSQLAMLVSAANEIWRPPI
ncbi:hypothetical protein AB1Y20_007748 [Prymnesium parvum]|uniref:Uncharacterized protein n=1 Tax=Prymnesium parvum TaxID=97485 RepID=A0AB34IV62_PRYPA